MRQHNQDMEVIAKLFHKMERLELRISVLENKGCRDALLESLNTLKNVTTTSIDQRLTVEAQIPLLSQLKDVKSRLLSIKENIDKKDQIFVSMLELLAQMDALTKVFKEKQRKTNTDMCETSHPDLLEAMKKMNRCWDSRDFLLAGPSLVFLKSLSYLYLQLYNQLKKSRRRNKQILLNDYREYDNARILNIPGFSQWDRIVTSLKEEHFIKILNEAMDMVENFNKESFYNILYNDFSIYKNDAEALREFIYTLNAIPINPKMPGEQMADIFLDLIRNALQLGFPNLGFFCIPPTILQLLIRLVDPSEGVICDHACGFGQLLAESARHTRLKQINPERIHFFGQERNEVFFRLCRMLLPMLQHDGSRITCSGRRAPTLPHPHALKADFLVSSASVDEDYIPWIQTAIELLADGGRAGLIFPKNAIESSTRDTAFRRFILEQKILKCVISIHLPPAGPISPFPLSIWLLEKPKNEPKKNHKSALSPDILFINIPETKTGKNASLLSGLLSKKLIRMCQGVPVRSPQTEIKDFSKMADAETIQKNNFSLAPESYL